MTEAEIRRLKREIHRIYGSSPHKKKVWLASLEMYAGREIGERQLGRKTTTDETTRRDTIDSASRTRRSLGVLFTDKVQSDRAGMGKSTMFKKVNALPSSER
jgi:hypothetical protein